MCNVTNHTTIELTLNRIANLSHREMIAIGLSYVIYKIPHPSQNTQNRVKMTPEMAEKYRLKFTTKPNNGQPSLASTTLPIR